MKNKETDKDKKLIYEAYESLLNDLKNCSEEDRAIIERAFKFACKAHQGVRRKSGEPYVLHPIQVAHIAVHEMGLGTTSIVSAFLHDVVEDTDYSVEDIKALFGETVAQIVDGLTKITGVFDKKKSMQAENFRKMLLTLSNDFRVILIKMADRLHNMRTLGAMPQRKQLKIAGETLYLFAPLAHRMGMYVLKTELENLSLSYKHPEDYKRIAEKIKAQEIRHEKLTAEILTPVHEQLEKKQINYSLKRQSRSVYSIWNKMQNQNIKLDEIPDILSILLVFKPERNISERGQFWEIYSIITDIYKAKDGRTRDWIGSPKANGYEALHATVMTPKGRWVEFQIRTEKMNDIAERGLAAHAKHNLDYSGESEFSKWRSDMCEILDNPDTDAMTSIDTFKLSLYSKEIHVFTPKGDEKILPKNATVLDFAYEIHTDIGDQCIGAQIQHQVVSPNHVLQNGDQIKILSSEKASPKPEWQNFVITAKAKLRIKQVLRKRKREYMARGMKILERELTEAKLPTDAKSYRKLVEHYKMASENDFFYQIGTGKIKLKDAESIVRKKSRKKLQQYWTLNFFSNNKKQTKQKEPQAEVDVKKTLMLDAMSVDKDYRVATCCHPIPGDDIVGYLDTSNKVIIHKSQCLEAMKLMASQGDQILTVKWEQQQFMAFLTLVQFSGIDRIGIVNELTGIISKDHSVNMRSISFDTSDGVFEGLIYLYVHSTEDLNNLIAKLIKIEGIENVKRIEKAEK